MSCLFSRDLLALHVEGDLPEAEAIRVARHLSGCPECQGFFDELHSSQSALKALRQETCSVAACSHMRNEVMSVIRTSADSPKWSARVERAIFSGLRQRGFALASLATVVAAVSVLLLTQLGHAPMSQSVALYEAGDRLMLPDGYRNWTPLSEGSNGGVYISPSAYREFVSSGAFPEGAVLVRESESSSIQVSVKDARFEGGWGFFEFSGAAVGQKPRAATLAGLACRSCHEQKAGTDHVFTQFYPTLRGAIGES